MLNTQLIPDSSFLCFISLFSNGCCCSYDYDDSERSTGVGIFNMGVSLDLRPHMQCMDDRHEMKA